MIARALVAFLRFTFFCALPLAAGFAASSSTQLTTTEKNQLQREARLVVDLLQNYHYTGRSFREIENTEMITRYLSELDPGKDFFTDDDVTFYLRRFNRSFKSVYLFRGDLQPAFEIFDSFNERAQSRLKWIIERLGRPFEFTAAESFDPSPTSALARGTDQYWELRLKAEVLAWVLAGKEEFAARESLQKFYRDIRDRVRAIDSFALRERLFDAVIRSFDPHSGYFSADSTREFAQLMENAATGVGLELHKEDGRYVVARIQRGGPADLESELEPGDFVDEIEIDDQKPVPIAGKRARDVAALLQGPAGTKIHLTYRRPEISETSRITLAMRRVVLTEQRAYGSVHTVPTQDGKSRRIGFIMLPSFYVGGEDGEKASVAVDVRELLEQMLVAPLDGVVIDVRENPGGALTEAVDLSRLFINEGIVMRTRGPTGEIETPRVEKQNALYPGPLLVLTSARSASASEIFAGAMKYHQRAVVVGQKSTFGKGTVQNYIELPKLPGVDAKTSKDWGTLRLTAQRFYQPDGKSVQNAGITSDIVLPLDTEADFKFEADLPHALPADSIETGLTAWPRNSPAVVTPELIAHLAAIAAHHTTTLPEWLLVKDEQSLLAETKKITTRSLRLTDAEKEWTERRGKHVALKRRREALAQSERYPTEPRAIALVRSALDQHQAKLLRLDHGEEHRLLNRLRGQFYTIKTTQDRLWRMPLADIDLAHLQDKSVALAATFSRAANVECTPLVMEKLLTQLAVLEDKTETTFLATATAAFAPGLEFAAARTGLEAVLAEVLAYDINYTLERPALDVPAREALRLAAAWADWAASPPPKS